MSSSLKSATIIQNLFRIFMILPTNDCGRDVARVTLGTAQMGLDFLLDTLILLKKTTNNYY